MNQRKVKSIRSKLGRLARNKCTNYNEGSCPIQSCGQCVVTIETVTLPGNVCPYFMRHVLPADLSLQSEYAETFPKGHILRKKKPKLSDCKRCGDPFEKRGNAAKYCDDCRRITERDKARARKQKERRGMSRN
ncbi:cysteine-rich VLP protein [Bacillus massiliglaciei]|uniref:cysteine-rich VLP protein n=1 Tax=Bacillus massiliglaciei TaxID=1816693 RepID=UPI0018FEAC74|nr:cysteine-rich VLP protein [Bacillus massiliglaciei]